MSDDHIVMIYRAFGPECRQEAAATIKTSSDPETDALAVHFGPEGGCVESEEEAALCWTSTPRGT